MTGLRRWRATGPDRDCGPVLSRTAVDVRTWAALPQPWRSRRAPERPRPTADTRRARQCVVPVALRTAELLLRRGWRPLAGSTADPDGRHRVETAGDRLVGLRRLPEPLAREERTSCGDRLTAVSGKPTTPRAACIAGATVRSGRPGSAVTRTRSGGAGGARPRRGRTRETRPAHVRPERRGGSPRTPHRCGGCASSRCAAAPVPVQTLDEAVPCSCRASARPGIRPSPRRRRRWLARPPRSRCQECACQVRSWDRWASVRPLRKKRS